MTLFQLAEKMSYNPAQVRKCQRDLTEDKPADVIIADTKKEYIIQKADFVSKGKNTPFEDEEVTGKSVNHNL